MKKYFSVFSGVIYQLDEKYTKNLDCGQLEITNMPKSNCKKCLGKGYTGKDLKTDHYNMCPCTLKDASPSFLKAAAEHQIQDVQLNTKKTDFDSIVDEIYS